jgi:hypothetical protein
MDNKYDHEIDLKQGVVLAVYAPFGTDALLSEYPNSTQATVKNQALVRALQQVSRQGVNVSALVDLYDDDSYLVEIPAGQPSAMQITSAWKQDMSSPRALAGFLRRTHHRFPCDSFVLALEGHGAGFIPDIDPTRITPSGATRWERGGNVGQIRWTSSEKRTGFEPEPGSPALPMFSPELPMFSPELPTVRMPLSTWGLGEALRLARRDGVPAPLVVHFNNCFNMAIEVMHTLMPHAKYATGYCNYNFFTAGASYPKVFQRLRANQGRASAQMLARWFAAENAAALRSKGNHPTIGASVRLAKVRVIAAALDDLANALVAALRPGNPADRPAVRNRMQTAIAGAQQYDSEGDYALDVPDQSTDLGSLAGRLKQQFTSGAVFDSAERLEAALKGVWQYGDFERPWVDENQIWDFRDERLGMGILLPDPTLEGRWDWRSPYYLSGRVDPNQPPAHKHVIGFLAERPGPKRPPWVEFIVEYHKDVPFVGLLRAQAPQFPRFNRAFKPEYPPPRDDQGKDDGSHQSA